MQHPLHSINFVSSTVKMHGILPSSCVIESTVFVSGVDTCNPSMVTHIRQGPLVHTFIQYCPLSWASDPKERQRRGQMNLYQWSSMKY